MSKEEQEVRVLAPRVKWWPRIIAIMLLLLSGGLLAFVYWGWRQL